MAIDRDETNGRGGECLEFADQPPLGLSNKMNLIKSSTPPQLKMRSSVRRMKRIVEEFRQNAFSGPIPDSISPEDFDHQVVGRSLNLKNRDFERVMFLLCNASDRVLLECAFSHCEIRQSSFLLASLQHVETEKIVVSNSDFRYSRWSNCSVRRSKISEAVFIGVDFSGCILSGTHFSKVNFFGANFESADLSECTFDRCALVATDMRGVDLRRARSIKSDFTGSDTSGVKLGYGSAGDGFTFDKESNFHRTNLGGPEKSVFEDDQLATWRKQVASFGKMTARQIRTSSMVQKVLAEIESKCFSITEFLWTASRPDLAET